jgi:hypothetical protein
MKHMRAQQVGVPDVITRLKRFDTLGVKTDLAGMNFWLHIFTTNDEEFLCCLPTDKSLQACIQAIEKQKQESALSCWKKVTEFSGGSSSAPLPAPRYAHAFATIGNKFYIHGGLSTASNGQSVFLDDVWVFNAENKSWERPKLDKSVALVEHAACSVGSSVYIYGGHKQGEYSTKLFEIAARTFNTVDFFLSDFQTFRLSDLVTYFFFDGDGRM